MAYGLVLTGGTPDSQASLRIFIDKVSQNFRKLEDSLGGGVGDPGAGEALNGILDPASGDAHFFTFVSGLLSTYSRIESQPPGINTSVEFTDAAGNHHTVGVSNGVITVWDVAAP